MIGWLLQRRVLAGAIAGLGAALLARGVLGLGIFLSLLAGIGVWVAMAALLGPRGPLSRLTLAQRIGADGARVLAEMDEARARIGRLRSLRSRLSAQGLRGSLGAIADTGDALLRDLERNPADYRRVRKALVQYLGHVDTIADRLAYLHQAKALSPELLSKTEATLVEMERVFAEYRRRMVNDEEFDIDARLSLLEQEMKADAPRR